MFNPDKYRSVTWLKGGRVYPQLDCFGIVNEIRRDLGLPVWGGDRLCMDGSSPRKQREDLRGKA